MKKFSLSVISLALAALSSAALAQQSSEVGKITVTGEGDKLGAGLIIDEDTPKAKSTVTKAQIDKMRSSSNPYQALSLAPGVNASSFDATGLFGGNLRVRGFNSDQMGFTINGAPVNDSGSFSVFPQEYTDAENLCEIFVTQGATDNEAPHVGASGGNVGMTTCAPNDVAGGKFGISGGSLRYQRTFLRGDTGKIGNFKAFISASKSQVQKFRGPGRADREHVDGAVEYKIGNTTLKGSVLYNNAVTNNYRALTLGELGSQGYFADFAAAAPQHPTPVAGTPQTEAAPPNPANSSPAYYGYSLNPFKNYLITTAANIQITPALRVDVEPYFWYGYGTGGTQQTVVTERQSSDRLHGGLRDLNGDGDLLDTVTIYRGSVTRTNRPGITLKTSYTLDNHKILGGVWYERARHRQTAPGTLVGNDGSIGDLWLRNSTALLHYADGSLYQNRDVLTVNTGESVFIQDTIDLMNSKLQVTPAVSYRSLKRDFTNFPSAGSNAPNGGSTAAYYKIDRTYSQWLPSLSASFQVAQDVQLFGSVSKNFKAPGNFEYFGLGQGVTVTNGVGTATGLAPLTVGQETSVNVDAGVRYKNDMMKASATAFYVKFKNRIASSFDPITTSVHDYNVGDSTIKGLELEVGSAPVNGFSAYASATFTQSEIDNNMPASATTFYPTAGVQFPDTPKGMAALSLQYATGPFMVNLAGKFTSNRNLTLVGDQHIGGFTTVDLNAAYQLPTIPFLKSATVRFNTTNLLNRRYLLANSGSGSNIGITATATGPQIYTGAPVFHSLTLSGEF